jgi:hypothetical protein
MTIGFPISMPEKNIIVVAPGKKCLELWNRNSKDVVT